MELRRLELSGFNNFKTPALIDFDRVGSGIVAITGRNGSGKSTIMDAALGALYGPGVPKAFPSREGTLADYATSRKAYIDAIWRVDTEFYRARVNVDGQSRDSDAVIQQHDGAYRALNDGKVTTFRETVKKIFPSRRQVLASVYAAQGREGSFVTLDQKSRMELFYELLADLKEMERMAATAKTCAEICQSEADKLIAHRDALAVSATDEVLAHSETAIAEIEHQILVEVAAEAQLKQNIKTLTADQKAKTLMCKAHAVAKAQRENLTQRQAKLLEDLAACTKDYSQALDRHEMSFRTIARALESRLQSLKSDAAHAKEQCSKIILDRENRIAQSESLLLQSEAISSSERQKESDEKEAQALKAQLREQRGVIEAGNKRYADLLMKRSNLSAIARELESAVENAAIIDQVPFGEKCADAGCGFVSKATSAREKIPELRQLLDGLPALDAEISQNIESNEAAKHLEAKLEAGLRDIEYRCERNTLWILSTALSQATDLIAQYKKEIKEARENLERQLIYFADESVIVKRRSKEDTEAKKKELAQYERAFEQRQADLQTQLRQADEEWAHADRDYQQTLPAQENLEAIEAMLAVEQDRYTETVSEIAGLRETLKSHQKWRENCLATRAAIDEIRVLERQVEEELLTWKLLTKALSRDGLPKLEVDAAGPTVAGLTNDLLSVGYGTRFTIDIVTQVPKADGKGMKEDFDIRIFDNEFGGVTRSISDLSGGERVVVEEALRSAIALFHNSRNVNPIRTMWRDETTGALDDENRPKYIAMLRRIQQIGDFTNILFVTHDTQLAAKADAWIQVDDGKLSLYFPPYEA